MNKVNNPTDNIKGKRGRPKTTPGDAEYERTIPGRRNAGVGKQSDKIVNEDEQLKDVNNKEDNAQTPAATAQQENPPAVARENENERLEAGYDNSEVHPRPPKVN